MRLNIYLPLVFALSSSCLNLNMKEEKSLITDNQKSITKSLLDSLKPHFIYTEAISHFNPDSINSFTELMGKDRDKPMPILQDLHLKIFQNPNTVDSITNEHTYYLYNIQNHIQQFEFTVIGTNDDWINQIILLSYDTNGKLIDQYIMTELGGDQELFIESESILLDDKNYLKKTRRYEYDITINDNKLIDSSSTKIHIKKERL